MNAHVLLNLLNELGNKSILSVFPNGFNKFNNTGARMQGPIYYLTLKLRSVRNFLHQNVKISPLVNVKLL